MTRVAVRPEMLSWAVEPTFADAILDRLVHNAYRLELDGQSFRKKDPQLRDETPEN